MGTVDIDDMIFYNASLDVLLKAVKQDDKTEEKQNTAADTEDTLVKVEKYQRQTTEER